jgi:chaperonin cofactor prefoldin
MKIKENELNGWIQKNLNPIKLVKDDYKIYEKNGKILLDKNNETITTEEFRSEKDKIGIIKAFTFAVEKDRV